MGATVTPKHRILGPDHEELSFIKDSLDADAVATSCLRVASGDIWGSRTCSPVCSLSRVFGVRSDPWRGHRKPPRHRLREPVSNGYHFGSKIPADFGRLRSSQNVHSRKRTGPPHRSFERKITMEYISKHVHILATMCEISISMLYPQTSQYIAR